MNRSGVFLVLLATVALAFTLPTDDEKDQSVSFLMDYIEIRYPEYDIDLFIYVEAKHQEMHIIRSGRILKSYPVSTAKNGTGRHFGSEMTPTGLHRIHSKVGHDAPLGGIIKGRSFTGEIAEIEEDPISIGTDDVTTRAIRLEGLEKGINKGGELDSFDRYIYIHGTPEEGLIGTPASHGCVRMKNKDIIEFFDLVEDGMYVLILNL